MLNDARAWFDRLYEQAERRRALKLLVIGAVGAVWVFSLFVSRAVSVAETILVTVLLVLFSLAALETDTYRIEELLASQTRALGEHRGLKSQIEELREEKPERGQVRGER